MPRQIVCDQCGNTTKVSWRPVQFPEDVIERWRVPKGWLEVGGSIYCPDCCLGGTEGLANNLFKPTPRNRTTFERLASGKHSGPGEKVHIKPLPESSCAESGGPGPDATMDEKPVGMMMHPTCDEGGVKWGKPVAEVRLYEDAAPNDRPVAHPNVGVRRRDFDALVERVEALEEWRKVGRLAR